AAARKRSPSEATAPDAGGATAGAVEAGRGAGGAGERSSAVSQVSKAALAAARTTIAISSAVAARRREGVKRRDWTRPVRGSNSDKVSVLPSISSQTTTSTEGAVARLRA